MADFREDLLRLFTAAFDGAVLESDGSLGAEFVAAEALYAAVLDDECSPGDKIDGRDGAGFHADAAGGAAACFNNRAGPDRPFVKLLEECGDIGGDPVIEQEIPDVDIPQPEIFEFSSRTRIYFDRGYVQVVKVVQRRRVETVSGRRREIEGDAVFRGEQEPEPLSPPCARSEPVHADDAVHYVKGDPRFYDPVNIAKVGRE